MLFAGRAVQLAQDLFGDSLESQFMERLALAQSNLPEHGDGRRVYEKFVRPAMVNWEQVGAHYAVNSLFERYSERAKIYCYRTERQDYQIFDAGVAKLAMGQVKLTSEITWESVVLNFGVLHMGDHHVNCGVQESFDDQPDPNLAREAVEAFRRADFAEVIRLMDRRFGESNYSLWSLFRDEQRKVLEQILTASLGEAEALYRQIYERRAPMMRFLTNLHIPLPRVFSAAAELVINGHLRQALEQEEVDAERVNALLEAAKLEGVPLDTATLEFAYRQKLERLTERLIVDPTADSLQQLDSAASLIRALPFPVDLWKIQNSYYRLLESIYPEMQRKKDQGDRAAQAWMKTFKALGRKLAVKLR